MKKSKPKWSSFSYKLLHKHGCLNLPLIGENGVRLRRAPRGTVLKRSFEVGVNKFWHTRRPHRQKKFFSERSNKRSRPKIWWAFACEGIISCWLWEDIRISLSQRRRRWQEVLSLFDAWEGIESKPHTHSLSLTHTHTHTYTQLDKYGKKKVCFSLVFKKEEQRDSASILPTFYKLIICIKASVHSIFFY
jgi:hypothetical protein